MAPVMAIAGLIGTGLQVMGTLQQGAAAKAAGNFENQQRIKAAAEERASSQRTAIEKRHEGDILMSKQLALAADSGAGVVTPSILDIYGDTAEQADYNARTETYGGESRARGQLDLGAAAKAKGKAANTAAMFTAFGEGLSGLSKAKFG